MDRGGGEDGPNARPEPTAGDRIGHFVLREELGRGAAGTAWLAEDLDIPGRRVALKLMHARGLTPDVEALRREASALAALQHPHILVVHEIGSGPAGVYLVTELLEGGSLADRLRRGPLALGEALAVGRATADALRAAHEQGILHRDVKAANLLFDAAGRIKVADFGLALRDRALTANSAKLGDSDSTISLHDVGRPYIAGTPGYISPEMLSGALPSGRSDVFSYGVTLHELLTGRRPFEGPDAMLSVTGEPRIDPALPRDVARIVRGCVARDPRRRYAGMADVVRALDQARGRRDPRRRRARRIAIAAVATVVLLAAGVGWMRWQARREAFRLNEEGRAALVRGDHEAARRAFLAAHQTDTRYEAACTNLGYLAALEANPDWAVTILAECAAEFPESVPVLYNLGAALRLTQELERAESTLRSALERAAGHALRPFVLNELALTLRARGRAVEAAELLAPEVRETVRTVEDAGLAKTLGLALLDASRMEQAAASLRKALGGPLPAEQRGPTLVALGRALEASGDREGALEAYSRALLENPRGEVDAEARAGLGRLQGFDKLTPAGKAE